MEKETDRQFLQKMVKSSELRILSFAKNKNEGTNIALFIDAFQIVMLR